MVKVLVLIISFSMLFGITTAESADMSIQTGFRYSYWDDNADNDASQTYLPIRLKVRHENFSAGILAGHAYTRFDGSDGGSESLFHLLDTKINLTYEVLGQFPVDMAFGLDFNLPTGKTGFTDEELVLVMDPYLMPINRFGEGLNMNPLLTIAKEWGDWVGGLGAGYTFRGEYDFSDALQDYDPGDIINVTAELRHYLPYNLNYRIFGNYAWFNDDEVKGEEFLRKGAFYLLGLALNYSRERYETALTVRAIFRDKGEFRDDSGDLLTENEKSHGDEYIGDFSFQYFLDDDTSLHSFFQALFITKNDYSADSEFFVGRREKYTLGVAAARVFSEQLECELSIKGFVMHDEESMFPEPKEARNYRGFSSMLQIVSRF